MFNLRTLWAEFKAFAFKGNMIELAIAVVIGGAFAVVIESLVKDVIMPSISYATAAVKTAKDATVEAAGKATDTVGLTTQPATRPSTQPSTTQSAATQPTTALGEPGDAARVAEQVIAGAGD